MINDKNIKELHDFMEKSGVDNINDQKTLELLIDKLHLFEGTNVKCIKPNVTKAVWQVKKKDGTYGEEIPLDELESRKNDLDGSDIESINLKTETDPELGTYVLKEDMAFNDSVQLVGISRHNKRVMLRVAKGSFK